ncbi:hypothetical protein P3T76_005873 [Phytophthora citrophthora]|uniref:Uncharacterized protein n=1 Tax=Phytophthora citrophthora TaxID=4793 RepID=A0AAD9GP50_9STRA|nr:hypothetical protein P3T76_005873 [Phytophthora citrophthora]
MDAIEQHSDVVAELREKLEGLRLEDDGTEEEVALDDQVCELKTQLEEYENVMERLLTAAGITRTALKTRKNGSGKDEESHGGPANDNTTIDQLEVLREALKVKTELLQLTEDKYEEFMVASYEVEKDLIHENETLKRLVNELQLEIACLQQSNERR